MTLLGSGLAATGRNRRENNVIREWLEIFMGIIAELTLRLNT